MSYVELLVPLNRATNGSARGPKPYLTKTSAGVRLGRLWEAPGMLVSHAVQTHPRHLLRGVALISDQDLSLFAIMRIPVATPTPHHALPLVLGGGVGARVFPLEPRPPGSGSRRL